MAEKVKVAEKIMHRRNDSLFDIWSIIHFTIGVLLGWVMSPFLALLIMVIWEPFEVLLLSPLLDRYGIVFGRESIRNSLSDIVFDALGVALGYWLILSYFEPPFRILTNN